MSSKKPKFYVVWSGRIPGVYTSWDECREQVEGFPGARYKAFASRDEAEYAAADEPEEHIPPHRPAARSEAAASQASTSAAPGVRPVHMPSPEVLAKVGFQTLCVDAACSGNPGAMEYRGVFLAEAREIFHFGPVHGTNNIGEFLAIVHALALLDKQGHENAHLFRFCHRHFVGAPQTVSHAVGAHPAHRKALRNDRPRRSLAQGAPRHQSHLEMGNGRWAKFLLTSDANESRGVEDEVVRIKNNPSHLFEITRLKYSV